MIKLSIYYDNPVNQHRNDLVFYNISLNFDLLTDI